MSYKEVFEFWKTDAFFDEATRRELAGLTDEKEIEDRFYRELEFGTAGLRGVLGAGSNRMNIYNVRKASTGFADFLMDKFGEDAKKRGVAIAYDCRNHSDEFARETALAFAASGIKAYLYTILSATPLLSYTVRKLGCCGGVVVTASHNPKEFNGYKAYDETGCQLGLEDADACIEFVNRVALTDARTMDYDAAVKSGLIVEIGEDILNQFVDDVETQAHPLPDSDRAALKVIYTPLHGTGLVPVTRCLKHQGFTGVTVVEAQAVPDGNFTTVPSPNPEEPGALAMGVEQAKAAGADLVIGTDPDCDRIGISVRRKDGEYQQFSGNQIGAVLTDYVLTRRKDSLGPKSTMIESIVSSQLAADIAASHGVKAIHTLTGFKFIGGMMNEFEKTGSGQFVIGYEESSGYLVGMHARDKDAVVAAMLICEMAAYYKAKGLTLVDVLEGLYSRFGYYLDRVDSFTLKGKDGQEKIGQIMADLRARGTGLMDGIKELKDYGAGCDGLPKSNVLKYILEGGSWMAVRPSGTEPKIKIYYCLRAENADKAAKDLAEKQAVIKTIIE